MKEEVLDKIMWENLYKICIFINTIWILAFGLGILIGAIMTLVLLGE